MYQPSNNLNNIVKFGDNNNVVVEFYDDTIVPPFDSASAILRFANVANLNVFGYAYQQLVLSYGRVKRTTRKDKNSFSVTLDNLSQIPANFELSGAGFEGKIMVVRLVSRTLTSSASDSLIFFVGRCLKPKDGNKTQMSIEAEQIFGSLGHDVPRRKFTPEDAKGRASSDPFFEGFIYIPTYGTTVYPRRKSSFFGLFKKTVFERLQWSSFSDIDTNKDLLLGFGRIQILGTHLAYADEGTTIKAITAFCEGPIKEYLRIYSTDFRFAQTNTLHKRYGYPPNLGPTPYEQIPIPEAGWAANGYYANTAWIGTHWGGTAVDQTDPAPDVAALMLSLIVKNLDEDNDFTVDDWSDNAAALARFALLDANFENLPEDWLNLPSFAEAYRYNEQFLFDKSFSDLIFAPTGFYADNLEGLLLPTGSATPDYFKYQNGDAISSDTYGKKVTPVEYASVIPVELPNPPEYPGPGVPSVINLSVFLRKRYTFNGVANKQQKLWDWLNEAVLPSSRMYLTQGFDGRVSLKHKKPADYGLGTAIFNAASNSLSLDDVSFWVNSLRGSVLVQPYSAISEVRKVTAAIYVSAQNSTTLSASANIAVTGFAGCDGAHVPASALLKVNSVLTGSGTPNSVTLDGEEIAVIAGAADTKQTVAGFFYGSINAHPRLRRKFIAYWEAGSDEVDIIAKFGTLTLDNNLTSAHPAPVANPTTAPTLTATASGSLAAGVYKMSYAYENANGRTLMATVQSVTLTANQKITVTGITPPAGVDSVIWYLSPEKNSSKLRYYKTNNGAGFIADSLPKLNDGLPNDFNRTGTEVLRVEYVFSDRGSIRTNLISANVLKDSYKFVLGRREDSVNLVSIEFRDATQDFRLVQLKLRDEDHIKKVKKENKLEIDGSGIESFNQAYRIASGAMAEARDADFFYENDSDREALFLEEGDVVCVADRGAGVVNLPVRIEDINYDDLAKGLPKANFVMRKYSSTLYDDSVVEREIPVFQSLANPPVLRRSNDQITIDGTGIVGGVASNLLFHSPGNQVGEVSLGSGLSIISNVLSIVGYSPSVSIIEVIGATAAQGLAVNTEYINNTTVPCTYTLPATAAKGAKIYLRGKSAAPNLWKVAQNSGQTIHGATDTTTGTGGSIAAQARYDTVALECITANTDWIIIAKNGVFTVV